MSDGLAAIPIRLAGCAKTFADGTSAVEKLDLDIAAGETLVLLGPSGCGKTTTLRLIAGLDAPDSGGRVFYGAADVTALPIERRNVGIVFQNYALFPNFDVRGNIGYGLRIRRLSRREQEARIDEMLEMMQIGALAERRIDQLSGGQKQRVALARAIAVRPGVLLLDEPLTALDAKLRDGLRAEISALLRRLGITAVYVTHDQAEAMALGDRIAIMNHGRIAQIGSPRAVYRAPADRFVAQFIGTMNRLVGESEGDSFRCAGGQVPWHGKAGVKELLFRPEDAELVTPERGQLAGTAATVHFLGDRLRLGVLGIGPEPVIVETSGKTVITVGETVHLRLADGAAFALEGA